MLNFDILFAGFYRWSFERLPPDANKSVLLSSAAVSILGRISASRVWVGRIIFRFPPADWRVSADCERLQTR